MGRSASSKGTIDMDISEISFIASVQQRRPTKGPRYERYRAARGATLAAQDPKPRELVRRANADIARTKDITPGVVHQNATLSSISIQYANDEYIGEQLMPIAPVNKKSDIYY